MAFAVAAAYAIGQHNAILFHPNSMTYMDTCLFFPGNWLDGSSGANLAATGAFGTAVAALKRHHRLHEVLQVGGGTQDIVRTARYAELASRAMALHVSG